MLAVTTMDIADLVAWFQQRPRWQQECASRIARNGDLSPEDYDELTEFCKKEASGTDFDVQTVSEDMLANAETSSPLRLVSVGEVNGVNALTPNSVLEFGDAAVSIVFGRNGSGKSGYVRLLKSMVGGRSAGEILTNVYSAEDETRSATVKYREDGVEKSKRWEGEAIEDLTGVEVYDTACGLVYVNEENEVACEPWLLRFFTLLTEATSTIAERIRAEKENLVSSKPAIPNAFEATAAGKWYTGLDASVTPAEIPKATNWTELQETSLGDLRNRQLEADPQRKARELRRRLSIAIELLSDLKVIFSQLSDDTAQSLIEKRADAKAKRQAADQDAQAVFSEAPLGGVGSESWRLLWEAARTYSESEGYKDSVFPVVTDGARCVLWQQVLSNDGTARFRSFEEFVKGELQRLANEAEAESRQFEESLPLVLGLEAIEMKLDGAGLSDDQERRRLTDFVQALETRRQSIVDASVSDDLRTLPLRSELVSLAQWIRQVARSARAYERDAADESRTELLTETRELEGQKWVNEQKRAIETEVDRLLTVANLDEAIELTATTALSRRKSQLTDELVTNAYVERFRHELDRLGAGQMRVALKKTRTRVGHAYYQIQLSATQTEADTMDVLSEGEFRVVSLAGFLADTEGRDAKTPFVFDDPISSLDHVYEEKTARRLVEVAKSRQVIVFTHRLSLVGFLTKYAEKASASVNLVSLSQHHIGQVTDLPINLKRTHKAVNELLDHRLPAVRKAFGATDSEYTSAARSLCSEIRILVERVVEDDLFNGIVKRFSPEVNTKGKISAVAGITASDCATIDDFMTKYSRYEHSQPDEAPIPLPEPDEIQTDLETVKKLIGDLRARNNAAR